METSGVARPRFPSTESRRGIVAASRPERTPASPSGGCDLISRRTTADAGSLARAAMIKHGARVHSEAIVRAGSGTARRRGDSCAGHTLPTGIGGEA